MNLHVKRGEILFHQDRIDLAEKELRLALVEEPNNALVHSILAMVLTKQERFSDAIESARIGITLSPDESYSFYAMSYVQLVRNDLKKAEAAIRVAIALSPEDADFYSQLSMIEHRKRRWKESLEAAEQGLSIDPEHIACINSRTEALVKLGRSIEADAALSSALQRSPEDAYLHANLGWSLLEQNKPDQALNHFREALRLEPELEFARLGIVEAMKARFFLYRWMLNWFLWMMKLREKMRWGIVVGSYVGFQVLRSIANNNPALAPWITPILVLYIVFAVMTWVASPLFNLVLRTNKFGRLALSSEEIRTSTWVGCCVVAALIGLVFFAITSDFFFLMAALTAGLLIPPISRIDSCSEGWPRATISLITIGLGFLSFVIVSTSLLGFVVGGQSGNTIQGIGGIFFFPCIVGAVATQFLINYLVSVSPRRGTDTGRIVWLIGGGLLAMGTLLVILFLGAMFCICLS